MNGSVNIYSNEIKIEYHNKGMREYKYDVMNSNYTLKKMHLSFYFTPHHP